MAPIRVQRTTVGRWKVNCYFIHDHKVGVIVDPGAEADVLRREVEACGFRPLAIIATHGHFDHVGAVAVLKKEYSVPFLLHRNDMRLLTHANLYRMIVGESTDMMTPAVDQFLVDQAILDFEGLTLEILHTPGHSAGGVCIRSGSQLLTGDTLFFDRPGRLDLPGGSLPLLKESLKRLDRMPPEWELLPGHGRPGKLGPAVTAALRGTT